MYIARPSKRAVLAVVAIFLLVGAFLIRFPRDPLYLCQKILDGGLQQWKLEAGTNVWPNVSGDSTKSFARIERFLGPAGDHAYSEAYGYVPGLRDDDPSDLIFMYLKRMTRRTWNGDHSASIFAHRKWMVLGPNFLNFTGSASDLPEGGELIETTEFRRRLHKTLTFLRENNRPHWETVIPEHSRFLYALEHETN